MLADEQISSLVEDIRDKPELSAVSPSLVEQLVREYLEKYDIRSIKGRKERKVVIKEIRSQLRNFVGRFHASSKRLRNLGTEELVQKALHAHASTRERLESGGYDLLADKIKKCNPSVILDLGCGVNPLALISRLKEKPVYHAYDIDGSVLSLVKKYFDNEHIKGSVNVLDVTAAREYPRADVCIILKLLDLFAKDRSKKTLTILDRAKAKDYVISFATHTLSGKPMKHARRPWFETLLQNKGMAFETRRVRNEIFYFIPGLSKKGVRS